MKNQEGLVFIHKAHFCNTKISIVWFGYKFLICLPAGFVFFRKCLSQIFSIIIEFKFVFKVLDDFLLSLKQKNKLIFIQLLNNIDL